MAIYAKLGGFYVGLEPGTANVYANRTQGGSWEALTAVQRGAKWELRLNAAMRTLSGTLNGLEPRPLGTFGEWEQWQRQGTRFSRADISLELEGLPAAVSLTPITARATDLVDASGARIVLKGTDQFLALRQFKDGGPQALQGAIQESQALGFDTWRVFGMGSKAQNQVMDLRPSEAGYYEALRPFSDFVNAQGIRLLFTVFVDAQDVMPDAARRAEHWRRVDAEIGPNHLLSYGNERDKNGTRDDNPVALSRLWSRGSWTQDPNPYQPLPKGASFAEFHPRRDLYRALLDSVASPVTIWSEFGVNVPLLIDEPSKFGTNGSGSEYADPKLAWKFARHYATECAGAVFHNYFGQRGLLMDGPTSVVAEAWQRGMKI